MKTPTPADRLASRERPAGRAVMSQQWAELLFLHWAVPAETLQTTLPPGLHVDTFNGTAWLGVVPFFMNRICPTLLPPLPGISWFLELNVRTYVHDEHGTPGAEYRYDRCLHGSPAEPGSLEFFLVERYHLFSATADRTLFRGSVHHAPYRIAPVQCDAWSAEPIRLDGLSIPEGPPVSILGAEPVEVSVFPLRSLRG